MLRSKIIFLWIFVFSFLVNAQKIEALTPLSLYEKIKNSPKPAVVQFWIPNCENRVEIVKNYQNLIKTHGENIDFYFIGITNKEELIADLMAETQFSATLYMADKSISPNDIYQRLPIFSHEFSRLVKGKKKDFITAYLSKNQTKTKFNHDTNPNLKLIKKLK